VNHLDENVAAFEDMLHDPADPDPWLAMYLDGSIPISLKVKAALLQDTRSGSRQFLLPLVRPLARMWIVLIQILKVFIPNKFTSSKVLHRILYWGMKTFVSPNANYIILRHFNLGSEILDFLSRNIEGVTIPLKALKPTTLEAVKDDLFLQHDLNLYNFIIRLNKELREKNIVIKAPENLDLRGITTDDLPLEPFPNRWTNVLDAQTAIFTPVYQLFLTDNDFWRAVNSLQLDETIGIYSAKILNNPHQLFVVNNKHPLVPMITIGAAYRLILHGLSTETLHAMLCEMKKKQLQEIPMEV
jgi:hypothetical protein